VDDDDDPFTMTGAAAEWKAFPSEESAEGDAVLAVVDPVTNIEDGDGQDDVVFVPISPTDTRSLTPRVYYHEVRVIDSSGNERVVAKGEWELFPSPTDTP